jgi:hypothetical protein
MTLSLPRALAQLIRLLLIIGVTCFPIAVVAQGPLILIETSLPSATYASFALAKDSSSFAADSPENQGLLDKGFGNPLAVQQVLDRHVLLASPATQVLIPAPFGWRGFDDGKRTRLFTPTGAVGIVVSAMSTEGFANWDDAREQVWRVARESAEKRAKANPRYQARMIRLADGTFGMREMNLQDSDGPHSTVTVFRRHPGDPKLAVRINLFAPVNDFERYLGLLGLVVRDVQMPAR